MLATEPTRTMTRLNVPGPKARAILERDRKVVSHAYGRVADLVMDHGLRQRRSSTWTAIVSSTSSRGSPSIRPATAIPMWCRQSRTRPRSSCTSPPISITRSWVATERKAGRNRPVQRDRLAFFWAILAPRLSKVRDQGCRAITPGAPRFIGFMGGFHGRTLRARSTSPPAKTTQRRGFCSLQRCDARAFSQPLSPVVGDPTGRPRLRRHSHELSGACDLPHCRAGGAMWPASWSSRSRAKAAMWCRRPASSRACANCATNMAFC
jgi:hypothetical protein